MGTSSPWPGPSGETGAPGGEWSRLHRRLSAWRPGPGSEARLDSIAEDSVEVLRRTLREDPSAFGLYDAACAGGERLTVVMDAMAAPGGGLDSTDFAAAFVPAVGGEGGTIADAAVRRAAAATMGRMAADHPEALASGGNGWSGDLLCVLYQWFFADTVAEFLRTFIAEKIKIVVPVLPTFDPEDHIADWIAERVLGLVPDPCEEAAMLVEEAEQAEDTVAALEDPTPSTLAQVARALVPRAVGAALGMLTGADPAADAVPSTQPEEAPAT